MDREASDPSSSELGLLILAWLAPLLPTLSLVVEGVVAFLILGRLPHKGYGEAQRMGLMALHAVTGGWLIAFVPLSVASIAGCFFQWGLTVWNLAAAAVGMLMIGGTFWMLFGDGFSIWRWWMS